MPRNTFHLVLLTLWQMNAIMRLTVQLWNKALRFCSFARTVTLREVWSTDLLSPYPPEWGRWGPFKHHKGCLHIHFAVKCLCLKFMSPWRGGHSISSLSVKCQSTEQNFEDKRTLDWPEAWRHSWTNRAQWCQLWVWTFCLPGLCPTGGVAQTGTGTSACRGALRHPGSNHKITYTHLQVTKWFGCMVRRLSASWVLSNEVQGL